MTSVNELLAPGAVALGARAGDWREAITLGGRLLEGSGAITSAYTDAMIQSIEDNGPYIVVAPGFAFAHARPSEAVKRTAISWVRLAEPVEFGHGSHDPVDLVVALAAKDSREHTAAMKQLAGIIGDPDKRAALDRVGTEEELRAVLEPGERAPKAAPEEKASEDKASEDKAAGAARATSADIVESKGKILTVCGNGLGTSLFLKNTLDKVLDAWGWDPYVSVEATDTISAKGRAKEADFIMTSGEIARTLGDVGVPVRVIENFTSMGEIDSALRELYDV